MRILQIRTTKTFAFDRMFMLKININKMEKNTLVSEVFYTKNFRSGKRC